MFMVLGSKPNSKIACSERTPAAVNANFEEPEPRATFKGKACIAPPKQSAPCRTIRPCRCPACARGTGKPSSKSPIYHIVTRRSSTPDAQRLSQSARSLCATHGARAPSRHGSSLRNANYAPCPQMIPSRSSWNGKRNSYRFCPKWCFLALMRTVQHGPSHALPVRQASERTVLLRSQTSFTAAALARVQATCAEHPMPSTNV